MVFHLDCDTFLAICTRWAEMVQAADAAPTAEAGQPPKQQKSGGATGGGAAGGSSTGRPRKAHATSKLNPKVLV